MSTGVKEVVKTGRQRPYALSIFSPMLSSPGGPGGGGVAGSVHPGRRCSFVVPVAGPVGPKLVWSEAVACGEKAEGGMLGAVALGRRWVELATNSKTTRRAVGNGPVVTSCRREWSSGGAGQTSKRRVGPPEVQSILTGAGEPQLRPEFSLLTGGLDQMRQGGTCARGRRGGRGVLRGPIEVGANGWALEFQPQGALSWVLACAMAAFGLVSSGDGPEAGPEAGPDRAWAFEKRRWWKLVPNGNRMWRRPKRKKISRCRDCAHAGAELSGRSPGRRQWELGKDDGTRLIEVGEECWI